MISWIFHDVDMSKRRNKVLSLIGILVVATAVPPLFHHVDIAGRYTVTDYAQGSITLYQIHRNDILDGYTCLKLTFTPEITDSEKSAEGTVYHVTILRDLDAVKQNTYFSAWIWKREQEKDSSPSKWVKVHSISNNDLLKKAADLVHPGIVKKAAEENTTVKGVTFSWDDLWVEPSADPASLKIVDF